MKTQRLLFSISLVMGLIFSLFAGAVLAQDVDQPPEEPGISLQTDSAALLSPAVPSDSTAIAAAFSSGPDYDSGWIAVGLDQAIQLHHDLGGDTDRYVVDMQYRSAGSGVNQRYYGGADFGATAFGGARENDRVGAYWRSLTDTTIDVYRRPEDIYAEQVRIRIWVDAFPNYDSGWIALTPDVAQNLTHSLGGNPDDYVVDMQYRSSGSGVNQRYYGGADFGATSFNGSRVDDRVGAYWRSLTDSNISIYRRPEDDYASEVRVRIWVSPRATYDSGWVTINQDQALTLSHNIGGSTDDFVVDMQFKSTGSGVNQRYFGGADFGANVFGGTREDHRVGAYWRSLTTSSINIYRRPEDDYAEQVRIRIYRYWVPTPPDYDSGWVDITTDTSATLSHNLGGDPDDYFVDTQYRAATVDGINLRYYGGADFGANPAPGHSADDRVGAYWRSLNASSVTVYRRPEDTYAGQLRIRIWRMPKPDYDSGWVAKAPGEAATTLAHNLDGSVLDYLVDFQYRSVGSGVNQRYYGGADFGALAFGGGADNQRAGAYWRSLGNSTITMYRRPDDTYAEELRVRIWRVAPPAYSSGWVPMTADDAQTLTHNLDTLEDAYLVQMYQFDTDIANALNQRHLGGADFGNLPPSGYSENDRVGAYWRSLNKDSITLYRRPQDGFADFVLVRIWDYTTKTYLPSVLNDH